MKKLLFAVFCVSIISSSLAFANQNPNSLATDNRVKVVQYNENDVVKLVGSHLADSLIIFGNDEVIKKVYLGDSLAWKLSVSKDSGNMLGLEPQLPSSNTNLTVVTNKHLYRFNLLTSPNETASSKNVTYTLQFKYPEEEKAQLEDQIRDLQKTFMNGNPANPQSWNYNYSFYGSKNIAPTQAVDNDTFTVMKFPKNVPVPAIFSVDSHGNEALVNFHVQGDYVFIHGVYRELTLRNGEDVTSVYNDSFHTR